MKNPEKLKIGDTIYDRLNDDSNGDSCYNKYKITDFVVRETTGERIYIELCCQGWTPSMVIYDMMMTDAWTKTKVKKKAPTIEKVKPVEVKKAAKKKPAKKKKGKEVMRIILIITALCLVLSSCTSRSDANNALSALGFTDIQMTGYAWWACSKDDFYHTGFVAKNAQGRLVKGTVCSGLFFKNSTVRF